MANKDSILNIILNIVKQGSGAKDAQADLSGLGEQLSNLATGILGDVVGFTTLAGAAYAVFDELKQDISAATDAETTMARLGATVQSTGRSSEISTTQIHQMAEGMRGLFSATDIEKATNELLRFMDIPTSQIPGDLVLIQNMAAGLGVTLPQAAGTLGMALETGRLRGLGFSREMQSMISSMMSAGDIAGADAIIIDQLTSKFGGQLAAALDTTAGKQAVVTSAWEDMRIAIGDHFLPIENRVADRTLIVIQDLDQLGEILGKVGGKIKEFFTGTPTDYDHLSEGVRYYTAELKRMREENEQDSPEYQDMAAALQEFQTQLALVTEGTTTAATATDHLNKSARGYVFTAEEITAATARNAAALKEQTSESQFLNDALGVITRSDQGIQVIEDQITEARKQGYLDTGKHVTDLKDKLTEAQKAETTAMLKMVDQWIFTKDVMSGKMDMKTYMDLEVHQGLITQGEMDMATKWLDYATAVENNPAIGTLDMHVVVDAATKDTALAQIDSHLTIHWMGTGGPVEPNSYLWNEDRSSRPEVFVSGGGYILTKQDAQAALEGGGGGPVINLTYAPMISFADEAEVKMRLAPLIDQLVQKSKGRI